MKLQIHNVAKENRNIVATLRQNEVVTELVKSGDLTQTNIIKYIIIIKLKKETEMKKKNETRLRQIVAVSTQKGGAGKTTTVLNLATAIMLRGYKVLVIDTDPQCNLSNSVGWDKKREGTRREPGEPTIYNSICEGANIPVYKNDRGLYYTPSTQWMEDAESRLSSSDIIDPVRVLRSLFAEPIDDHTGEGMTEWKSAFDFIFIDTIPSMGRVTVNAICAAYGIIVPVELEQFAMDGYIRTIGKILMIKKISNPELRIHGILITKKDSRLASTKDWEEDLRKQGDVFETCIRCTVDLPNSQNRSFDERPGICHDIFAYKRGRCAVTEDFIMLANEYLRKWGE